MPASRSKMPENSIRRPVKSPQALFSCIMAPMTRLLMWLAFALLFAACEARPVDKYVLIDVDGRQVQQPTTATTVAGALEAAGVELAPIELVLPDLNDQMTRITHS